MNPRGAGELTRFNKFINSHGGHITTFLPMGPGKPMTLAKIFTITIIIFTTIITITITTIINTIITVIIITINITIIMTTIMINKE